jgi:hypothetical protein
MESSQYVSFRSGWNNGYESWAEGSIGRDLMKATAIGVGGAIGGTFFLEAMGGAFLENLTVNTGRQAFINGFSNFSGQYVTNGFDLNRIDFFDVGVSSLTGGYSSIVVQSSFNFTNGEGLALNENFFLDLTSKLFIQGVYNKVKIPTNTFLGDRPIFTAGNVSSKSAITAGVLGITSQFKQ